MNQTNGSLAVHNSGALARPAPATLADVLERVLDKGVVVVGDIGVTLLDIELLTLRLRLVIASADTAEQLGIDWWKGDSFFSANTRELEQQNHQLAARVAQLEKRS
jgi:hypothetical protein